VLAAKLGKPGCWRSWWRSDQREESVITGETSRQTYRQASSAGARNIHRWSRERQSSTAPKRLTNSGFRLNLRIINRRCGGAMAGVRYAHTSLNELLCDYVVACCLGIAYLVLSLLLYLDAMRPQMRLFEEPGRSAIRAKLWRCMLRCGVFAARLWQSHESWPDKTTQSRRRAVIWWWRVNNMERLFPNMSVYG